MVRGRVNASGIMEMEIGKLIKLGRMEEVRYMGDFPGVTIPSPARNLDTTVTYCRMQGCKHIVLLYRAFQSVLSVASPPET